MMTNNFEVIVERDRLQKVKDSKVKIEQLPTFEETGEILTLQHTKIKVEQAK